MGRKSDLERRKADMICTGESKSTVTQTHLTARKKEKGKRRRKIVVRRKTREGQRIKGRGEGNMDWPSYIKTGILIVLDDLLVFYELIKSCSVE